MTEPTGELTLLRELFEDETTGEVRVAGFALLAVAEAAALVGYTCDDAPNAAPLPLSEFYSCHRCATCRTADALHVLAASLPEEGEG